MKVLRISLPCLIQVCLFNIHLDLIIYINNAIAVPYIHLSDRVKLFYGSLTIIYTKSVVFRNTKTEIYLIVISFRL